MSIVARRLLLRGFAGLACLLVLVTGPLALAAAGAPGTGPSGAPPPGGGPVEVPFARVIDGHTLEAWIDTHRVGIEVIGIDVPQGNTPCGREATAALRALVKGGVRLEDDPALATSPRKLRLYHAIARDGRLIGEEMARAGVARANGQGNRRQQLADAERQ